MTFFIFMNFLTVRLIVSRFDLDPNRVLDLVLGTWQNYLDKSEFFLQLVKLFPKQDDALCRMLGYSFAFHEVL